MSPAALDIALQLLALAIKEAPQIKADITALLSKTAATEADWLALRAKIAGADFAALAPHAAANLPAA